MSVLIRGMEIPTSCSVCPIRDELCCPFIPGVPALWKEYTIAVRTNKRHSHCPLVAVPPHGRLIDANAIPYNKIMLEDGDYYYGVTKPHIDRMPTIIPADLPVMYYPQVPGITPTVISDKEGER